MFFLMVFRALIGLDVGSQALLLHRQAGRRGEISGAKAIQGDPKINRFLKKKRQRDRSKTMEKNTFGKHLRVSLLLFSSFFPLPTGDQQPKKPQNTPPLPPFGKKRGGAPKQNGKPPLNRPGGDAEPGGHGPQRSHGQCHGDAAEGDVQRRGVREGSSHWRWLKAVLKDQLF